MDSKTSIFAILAIFCVLLSATAICAADQGGYAGSNYVTFNGLNETQNNMTALNNTTVNTNQTHIEPGAGLPLENQTGPVPANNTNNATNATNTTHAAGGDIHNTTSPLHAAAQTLHSTGNPILALLLVGAILGGVQILRRK